MLSLGLGVVASGPKRTTPRVAPAMLLIGDRGKQADAADEGNAGNLGIIRLGGSGLDVLVPCLAPAGYYAGDG